MLQPTSPVAPPPEHVSPSPVSTIRPDEIAEGSGKTITVSGTEIAVFKCAGQLYATQNWCPHAGSALAAGALDRDAVVCPAHAYPFDLRTGACATDAQLRLKTYRLVPDGAGFTVQE